MKSNLSHTFLMPFVNKIILSSLKSVGPDFFARTCCHCHISCLQYSLTHWLLRFKCSYVVSEAFCVDYYNVNDNEAVIQSCQLMISDLCVASLVCLIYRAILQLSSSLDDW